MSHNAWSKWSRCGALVVITSGAATGCAGAAKSPTAVPSADGAGQPVVAAPEAPRSDAEASFEAAAALAEGGDHEAAIAAYQDFLAQHGSDPEQAERAVEAELRLGQAHAARGDRAAAEQQYRATLAAFEARGLLPATDAAGLAAEAQFRLAEYALGDVLDRPIVGGPELTESTKALFDGVLAATKAYDAVLEYRHAQWALAAMFRRGFALETMASSLRQAPVPAELPERTEAWYAYKDIVESFASKADAKAVEYYEQTVQRGEELHVANEWTRSAQQRLAVHRPGPTSQAREVR